MTESIPEKPEPNEFTSLAGNFLGAILVGTIDDHTKK